MKKAHARGVGPSGENSNAQNSTGPPNEAAGRKLPSAGNCVSKEKETQMLDTSSRANFKPTAEIDDLDALAKEVCRHLAASTNAAQNFLEHALAAGDALIRAKKQVKPGNWYGWLRSCDLSEDKAPALHAARRTPCRAGPRTRAGSFAPHCPETDRQATARQFQTEEKEGGHQLRRARVVVKRLSRSSIPLHSRCRAQTAACGDSVKLAAGSGAGGRSSFSSRHDAAAARAVND